MKGFPILSGLKLRHFLDTTAEVHALTQGFCEVLCPWPARHPLMSRQRTKEVQHEHHYYMLGRVLAVLAWLTISCIIREVLF